MEQINYLLGYKNLKLYQNDEMFKFSIDSILLPNFVTISSKCRKILDIGTGNAVIPIILSTKTNSIIDAVEIQEDVYQLGRKSIKLNKLTNQIKIYNEDIKNYYLKYESDIYDTITCNPPFFNTKDKKHQNDSKYKTLARHELSLTLDDIMKVSRKLLKNNGNIAIVHRTDRLVDIIETMRKNNIEPKKIQFVYSNEDKPSNILLIEGTKNGKPGLKILEPLYLHNQDGTYSSQVMKYFKN